MITDEAGCNGQPCRRATITPDKGDGQIDWVLLPSHTYRTFDNASVVGFTGSNGLFAFPNFRGVDACNNQVCGGFLDVPC